MWVQSFEEDKHPWFLYSLYSDEGQMIRDKKIILENDRADCPFT